MNVHYPMCGTHISFKISGKMLGKTKCFPYLYRVIKDKNMRKSGKYQSGYLPKIEFWEAKYLMALEEGINCYARGDKKNGELNHLKAKAANEKLMYFRGREESTMEVKNVW